MAGQSSGRRVGTGREDSEALGSEGLGKAGKPHWGGGGGRREGSLGATGKHEHPE